MENNEQKFNWKQYPNGRIKASSTTIEGKEVINLTPDFDRRLALVDLQVLNRLTEHLPVQGFNMFKNNLKEKINMSTKLEEMVQICEDFVAFHKTVNLIQEVCLESLEDNCEETECTVDNPKKKEKVRMDKM